MSAVIAILRLPAVFALLLALLVCSGCGQVTSRHVAPDNASIASQDSVAQPADDVVAKPLVTTPAEEQPTSEPQPQPLLFADDRPEPYQPRGPPGLTFLPFFPAPLLLPADVVMPGELGVVVERVVRGNVVVAWAAISPVGWRVGRLAGPQAVGFRYYNPQTGRYISRDPIGYGDGMNVYAYVKNNPINSIDPHGLWDWLTNVILPVLNVASDIADTAYGVIDNVGFGLASKATASVYGQETADKIVNSDGYKVGGVISYLDPKTAGKNLGKAVLKAGVDYVTDQVIEETLGEVDGLNEARMMAGAKGGKPSLPAVDPKARGRASETRVLNDMNEKKNTKVVSTPEGNTIPDFENKTQVGEIKDTKTVNDTQQMRAQRQYAEQMGKEHVVVTGENTHVSAPFLEEKSTIIRRPDLGPPPPPEKKK